MWSNACEGNIKINQIYSECTRLIHESGDKRSLPWAKKRAKILELQTFAVSSQSIFLCNSCNNFALPSFRSFVRVYTQFLCSWNERSFTIIVPLWRLTVICHFPSFCRLCLLCLPSLSGMRCFKTFLHLLILDFSILFSGN